MTKPEDRITKKIQALAYYQIAGGIMGIGLMTWLVIYTSLMPWAGLYFLILLLSIGLYCFSIFCGDRLLRRPALGIQLSIYNQILQIMIISVGGYAYKYISGLGFFLGLNLTENLKFIFELALSSFKISLTGTSDDVIVGVNFLAIYLIYFMENIKSDLEEISSPEALKEEEALKS